jgi:GST-like protein
MNMIDLYMWATPNGYKASIMLEELGLPYTVRPIDIGMGEQFAPAFLEISPNNKIPAIVDPEGPDGKPISVFESGAILIYLGQKTGKLLPADRRGYTAVMEWLMFQMSGLGPMCGQAHHFLHYAKERNAYATERYRNEVHRLYGVMNTRLERVAYLAGADYTIADVATFPWVRRHERHEVRLEQYPNVKLWFETVAARPAVIAGLKPLTEGEQRGIVADAKSHELLFGVDRYIKP